MKNSTFLQEIERVWRENSLTLRNPKTLRKYLLDKKKEVVVTPIEDKTGRDLFFKALKPHASAKTLADFQRGITILKILKLAKVKTVPQIIKTSERISLKKAGRVGERGIFWSLAELLPIKDTILDERIVHLRENEARKIVRAIFDLQDKFQKYSLRHQDYLVHLPPLSRFLEEVSFWGQILFFEKYLKEKGFLSQEKTFQIKRENLTPQPQGSSFLLHGDLAPHNILLGKKVYFIDWERSFVTFNQEFGPFYDLANLYVYTWQNPKFQEVLRETVALQLKTGEKERRSLPIFTSFDLCVYYHLLYKSAYIFWYGLEKKNQEFLEWMRKTLTLKG